ncbi:MAG: FAD:protein FMN transferase [Treponema sp.]|nr:FAD:protein FMN transferase [Treponema sp.]
MLFFTFTFLFSGCFPAGSARPDRSRGRTSEERSSARSELALGTFCRIELFGGGKPELYNRLFSRLREIEGMMSVNLEDSEVSLVNKAAGIAPVPVSPELFTVLERAVYFAEVSNGAFDPTIGPLVKLWGIGGETPRVPGGEEIDAARALVNWKDLELTAAGPQTASGTAFLRRKGMELDLGAIAKGFAADELVKILRETKTNSAIVDLGGNIYVYGTRPGGGEKTWRVGLQNPLDERGAYTGYVELKEASVVTSGVYERLFTENGKRYHHILDTATGFPVENGLLAVTIMAASSTDADALSTAVFALGYEKGSALAEANGSGAIFIFADRTIRGSAGALEQFTLTDAAFHAQWRSDTQ